MIGIYETFEIICKSTIELYATYEIYESVSEYIQHMTYFNIRALARSSEGGYLGGGLKQAEFRLKDAVWSISQTASFSLFDFPNRLNSA